MFGNFLKHFTPDSPHYEITNKDFDSVSDEKLATSLNGGSFNNGLLSIVDTTLQKILQKDISVAFPAFKNTLPVAYDWLGKVYALWGESEDKHIYIFDPGTGDVLETGVTLVDFFNKEFTDKSSDVVAERTYKKWLKEGNEPITYKQCVGYLVPLQLGGEDSFENYETTDLEAYWSVMSQIISQIDEMEEGTEVDIEVQK
jgi:hypothetical protein